MMRSPQNRLVGILVVFSGILLGTATQAAPKLPEPEKAAADVNLLLREIWSEAFTNAAPMASEEAFFRRLSIDLRGVIPYPDEIDQFLNDRSRNKVSKWSGWFLQTPDHAEFEAEVWEHTLIGRKGNTDGLDRGSFRTWLRKSFLANKPYNELSRELLLSAGLPSDDPAVNFYLRYEAKPEDMEWADGYFISAPTRFGVAASQFRAFIDTLGPQWQSGALANKAVTATTSAQNPHGGQETTIQSIYVTAMHWGAIIVPPGYADGVKFEDGGNPYGYSCEPGPLSDTGKKSVAFQAKRLVEFAGKISG